MRNFLLIGLVIAVSSAFAFAQTCSETESDTNLLSNLGVKLYQEGKFEDSLACWKIVTARDDSSSIAWNNLAHCYFMMNDTVNAETFYLKSTAVGAYAEPLSNLGFLAFKRKDFKRAVDYFSQAAEMDPKNLQHRTNAGIAQMELKNYDEALHHFHHVLDIDPNFSSAISNAALLYRIKLIDIAEQNEDPEHRHESDLDRKRRFDFIYASHVWNMNDTANPQFRNDPNTPRSGFGSNPIWARWARHALEDVIHDFGIQSVIDAPCGDLSWMPDVDLQGAMYTGVDIVMQAVMDNRAKMAHRPDMQFAQLDIAAQVPPAHDLIFSRETLQHLTQGDALKALINFSNSGSKYLMATTFLESNENDIRYDVVHGFYYINLLKPPFSLPPPLRMYVDNPKSREYLGVWELPLWN